MQETIIKGTGNSRTLASVPNFLTLYPTYEAFAQALISGALPIDIGPLNSEGCKQIGTALNKPNLLKDATARFYGLGTNAVPDDVLKAIPLKIATGWRKLQSYTAAGAYTWTAPDLFGGASYEIGVLVIGGGGSGGALAGTRTGAVFGTCLGGGSGESFTRLITVSPGSKYNLVVGAGGLAVTATASTSTTGGYGNTGGSSSFGGYTANGGFGGRAYANPSRIDMPGAAGGQGSTSGNGIARDGTPTHTPYGGVYMAHSSTANYVSCDGRTYPVMCVNPFDYALILAAGGYANANNTARVQTAVSFPDGMSSAGVAAYDINNEGPSVVAQKGTLPGCGGGAACKIGSVITNTVATSAAGADGAVIIYVRGA